MNKPTQQQIVEAYKKLPPPVREFLADPDQLARVLTDIKNTHNLHVDVIGRVAEFIGYFLLGLASPNEFKDALKTAGVPESTTNDIIGEINQKIFVPLREEMRRGPAVVSEATKLAVSQPQQPAKPVAPKASPQSAAAVPPRPDWGSHASARVPSQPTTAIPTPPVPANIKPPRVLVPPPPISQRPALRDVLATVMKAPDGKQVSSEPHKLLEDHEEPNIEFKNKAPATVPNIAVHAAPSTASVSPKSTTPKVPPPPAKPYSIDPYREPLDEK